MRVCGGRFFLGETCVSDGLFVSNAKLIFLCLMQIPLFSMFRTECFVGRPNDHGCPTPIMKLELSKILNRPKW